MGVAVGKGEEPGEARAKRQRLSQQAESRGKADEGEEVAQQALRRAWAKSAWPGYTTSLFVDSRNVAEWVGGVRRVQAVPAATQERVRLLRNQVVTYFHEMGCGGPHGFHWVEWIPRRWNQAADYLATKGGEKGEARWLHGRHATFRQRDLVGFSDAGRRADGIGGLGWVVLDRERGCLVAAGRQQVALHDHSGDVNELEARALEVLLGVLICLRAGRAGELAPGLGASLSVRERAQVGRMAREARDEVLAARETGGSEAWRWKRWRRAGWEKGNARDFF